MTNQINRIKRHARIRSKISGTAARPRLCVYRSLTSVYAQLIDDEAGVTLVSVNDLKSRKGTKTESAKQIGLEVAKLAKAANIQECVFDRNGYKFHGRVKSLAEGAREGGLQF
jgi:large subunit ribosomal protein L18